MKNKKKKHIYKILFSTTFVLILVIAIALNYIYISNNYSTKNQPNNSSIIFSEINWPEAKTNWVTSEQIEVYDNYVILKIKNATWSRFGKTNSMAPIINQNTNAIEIVPESHLKLKVGDVISYNFSQTSQIISHRIVKISSDKDGWFCIARGDNNGAADPQKIRFSDIVGVVVAIIY